MQVSKRNNRRFSILGLCMHIIEKHGEQELANRLRTYKKFKGDTVCPG
jgi:hypothetical protein